MTNTNINLSTTPTTRRLNSRIYPWLVWLLGASFFFYKYLVQVSPSVMTQELMQVFQINGTGLGNLSACYFYAYLIMQIPVGILLDRFSPRHLTTFAIVTCALSTWWFAHTTSLGGACISRALIGFGAAFAAVSCFKMVTLWFSPNRFAMVSGLCMTAAMLGAIGGQLPLSILVESYGWRIALDIIAIAGLALSVLYLLIIQDKPAPTLSTQSSSILSNFKSILKNKQAWLLSWYSGLAFAPVSVFGGLWGVPFLQRAHSLSTSQAATAVSCIFIGFAIGSPLLGWISDNMGRRKPMMQVGTLIALGCLTTVIYVPDLYFPELMFLLLGFGFGASGFFISFAMIREVFPLTLAATVLGFMNTFDSICEAVSEPLVGALLDLTWDGSISAGVHTFSVTGYHLALLLLPVYLFIALILLFFITETYCNIATK